MQCSSVVILNGNLGTFEIPGKLYNENRQVITLRLPLCDLLASVGPLTRQILNRKE